MLVISTVVCVVSVIVCIHKHNGTVSANIFVLHEVLFCYYIEQIV